MYSSFSSPDKNREPLSISLSGFCRYMNRTGLICSAVSPNFFGCDSLPSSFRNQFIEALTVLVVRKGSLQSAILPASLRLLKAISGTGRAVGAVKRALPTLWDARIGRGRVAEWPVADPILRVLVLTQENATAQSHTRCVSGRIGKTPAVPTGPGQRLSGPPSAFQLSAQRPSL
jgi:hypothetical protein